MQVLRAIARHLLLVCAVLALDAASVRATQDEALSPSCLFPQGACGYVAADGSVRIEPRFDWAGPFSEGLAAVLTEDRVGYIDTSGEFRIGPGFLDALPFKEGTAVVSTLTGMGVIDASGSWRVEPVHGAVIRGHGTEFLLAKHCASYANVGTRMLPMHLNAGGLPFCFPRVISVYTAGGSTTFETFDTVELLDDGDTYIISKDGKYGLMKSGKRIVRHPDLDHIVAVGSRAHLLEMTVRGKRGLIARDGTIVVPPLYERVVSTSAMRDLSHGGVVAAKIDGKYGFIDATGTFVIEPQFDDGLGIGSDYFVVRKGKLHGIVGAEGTQLLPVENGSPSKVDGTDLYVVHRDGTLKLLDAAGTVIRTIQNCRCGIKAGGPPVFPAKWDGAWGFLGADGSIVKPPQFDDLRGSGTGYLVRLGQKWGRIDSDFNWTVPPKFDQLDQFDDVPYAPKERNSPVVFAAKIGSDMGIVDATGRTVLEFRYKRVVPSDNGIHAVLLHSNEGRGTWTLVDSSGSRFVSETNRGGRFRRGYTWVLNAEWRWCRMNKRGQVEEQSCQQQCPDGWSKCGGL